MRPPEKSYKKYLEKIKSFFKKQEEPVIDHNLQVCHDLQLFHKFKKGDFEKIILGITVGFVFGALASSLILYFKMEKLQKELLANMPHNASMPRSIRKPQFTNTPQILSVINNLSASRFDAFTSFYVSRLNEEKRQEQTVLKEQQPSPPPPPALPPLKALIGNSLPQLPPLPQISIIICSSDKNCYAISSGGQVYTDGFTQGNYKLVVTPTQAYWKKVKEK